MLADWKGETVVILGGGSSLTLAQIRRVSIAKLNRQCRVIAINDAVFVFWHADWLHACDAKWWRWYIHAVQHFAGIRTATGDHGLPKAWGVRSVKETGKYGYDPTPGHVRHGSNGTYQAMHLAIGAGASKIVLLGVDMHGAHWHEGHPDGVECDMASVMAPAFVSLEPALAIHGVEVVNCSPGSKLNTFAHDRLEDVLQ